MENCRGCGQLLLLENFTNTADGCPCNSRRGVNHGIVPKDTCTCAECDPEQTGSVRKPAERQTTAQMAAAKIIGMVSAEPQHPKYPGVFSAKFILSVAAVIDKVKEDRIAELEAALRPFADHEAASYAKPDLIKATFSGLACAEARRVLRSK